MSHTYPVDLDILLVGPTGASVILMNDIGGGYDINSVNLTFDDAAANSLPIGSQITTGTYKPTSNGAAYSFPSPAPSGPYGSLLAAFAGLDPNGDWKLFVVDDFVQDSGSISGGWQLNLTVEDIPEPATSMLLGGGLALFFIARRKMRLG